MSFSCPEVASRISDWEAVEAIVRLVLGRTMDDLVQRVAQMFVKEPPMVVAAPLPLPAPPSALALVRPQQRSPAVEDKRGAVAKSEMVLVSPKTASSAVGAGSAGKSRSHPVATSPKARISKPGQCRCRDSRDQIERLSMTWASSGDSSDVHPTANKPADSQVAVVPSRYSSVVDRPPWRHSFRTPSDVRTPGWSGPSRATPPVSPLASPRQRKDVVQKKGKATEQAAGAHERARGDALADARGDARGDAPAPDSAPAAAAHARSKVNIKSTASRIHHHQSSVQVLYETPPRPQPAPAHGHLVSPASPRPCQQQQRRAGTEIKVVKEAEAQGPLKPALSEAETQTHGAPGSGPCCRSVMNQVQELRNLITGLQRTLSQLGQDAKQRDTEADRCRQGVEFWQKRYEDLREELVRCQRAQNNLLIKSKPNDGYS
ncbi:uncharacterized protein LOC113204183 isoform X2 [Frankliniella occidentalis]|uniref:Uncharacterized protein LOC113204183 isoform X2 n=1 Tax=Frankliniella occidentalis TaxID=133901 RepID=A0A6J1S1Y7_FRAOC|nr:uncharacterized protein LOC113204183 isoform X2 [Frankliniella occidentalis]